MKKAFPLLLLVSAALPVYAQDQPRFSASIGSFYPGVSNNNRHSQTNVTYWPRRERSFLGGSLALFLDTNRHRTISRDTPAVTTVSATQALGAVLYRALPSLRSSGVYQFAGIGVYQHTHSETTAATSTVPASTVKSTAYTPGAKVGVGYQKNAVFVEAEYALVPKLKGDTLSGLSARVGFRL